MARTLVTALAVALLALPAFAAHAPAASDISGTTFTLATPDTTSFVGGVIDDAGAPGGARLVDEIPAGIVVDAPVFTSTVSNGAEPSILVDKLGRAILVGDHLGVLRSTNGGASWTRLTIRFIPGNVLGTGIFDGWALAQDAAGTIYASTKDGAVINVATSLDGGATWQVLPSTLFVDGGGIADRPWLAARGNGQVAVSWNMGGAGIQRCDYSTDSGLTFTQRTSPAPGLSGNGIPIGGLPAWDAQNRLVFVGNGFGNGGAATLYRYPNPPCGSSLASLPLPSHGSQLSTQVATNSQGIYVATPTASSDAMQVIGFPGFTPIGNKTLAVSAPTLKGNTFGTIATRPGEIAVGWYGTTTPGDFQTLGFDGQWNVYVTRIKDFWTATPQIRVDQVTATPNHVGDFCFAGTGCDVSAGSGDRDLLDYWQLTYDAAGNVHMAYGHDGATANAEVRYAKLPVWT
jgi:hypothetical protein